MAMQPMSTTDQSSRRHNPWVRLVVPAALAVLIVIALNVLLIRWMNRAKLVSDDEAVATNQPGDPVASSSASPSVAPTQSFVSADENPKAHLIKETKQDPLSTKVLKPTGPPTVSIKRIEPAEPQVGKTLEISLEASSGRSGKLKYEYRLQPGGKWEQAEGGRILLSKLPVGPLKLEVRVVDERGEASPIVTRRLEVKPMPAPVEKATARFKMGDKFYQEVVVTRQSAYRILGVEIGQNIQYGFISSFTVDKVEADGGCVFTQKVETARWGEGDAELKTLLADSLRKTEGAKFELTVKPSGEITHFKGAQDALNVFGDKNPLGGQTFLLWSFLDNDSWKELAQITFLQPDKPIQKGVSWTRPLNHAWGPLGGWTGKTAYFGVGKQAGLERIDYAHEMTYQPPKATKSSLPFQVQKADFKPQTAGGAILFDAAKSRVAAAEETFRVRGLLSLSVAGTEAAVEMDEAQLFRLRVLEQKPAK
jgi:hypothetical protein